MIVNHRRQIAGLLSVATLMIASAGAAQKRAGSDAKQEFSAKVNQYLEFRKEQVGTPLKGGNSSETIDSHREQSYSKLREARASAKRGDIFSAPVAAYFRRQIRATLAGPDGKLIRSSLRHAEPVKINVVVNGTYPPNVPLQSTPPSLLKNLPQLPQELEYRIVGRAFILRDTGANLILDFIPDALPATEGR
jgi:hypothetical protein